MQVSRRYDYVIIDCGPSLNLLNQNALSYVDEVIIPVTCDYLALVGVKQVLRTIKDVERHLGHAVRISAVLPTFYDGRTRLAREVLETLQGHFKHKCLEPIRLNTRLAEAPSHKKTIFEYAPISHGAADYNRVVDWVLATTSGRRDALDASTPNRRWPYERRQAHGARSAERRGRDPQRGVLRPSPRWRASREPRKPRAGTAASARPTHYKVICISMYTRDLEDLDAKVAELKRRGWTKANKSQLIRLALSQIDIDKLPTPRQ